MTSVSKEPFLLKDIYTPALIREYAQLVKAIWPSFPEKTFYKNVFHQNWKHQELKERMRHISSMLSEALPTSYTESVPILTASAEKLIEKHGLKMIFEYGFIADYVERFGIEHPELSISAMETITQLTSAEFAVRPYLLTYPDRMYKQMYAWADHQHPHVRRLASEGFRPRLPWGMGIPALKKDPTPILPVLEKLKNDQAETVRRSVANNLNDISKDHPSLALKLMKNWKGSGHDIDWVIKHAGRGLLKKGDEQTLRLFGFKPDVTSIAVTGIQIERKVAIGDKLSFSFTITNTGKRGVDTRVEYVIDYLTSTGKTSRKVFQIREKFMPPGMAETISRKQAFGDLTTRKHFPGKHTFSILVNGKSYFTREFMVLT